MDCNDTLVFIKEFNRMCDSIHCSPDCGCGINKLRKQKYGKSLSCKQMIADHTDECIAIVQEWSDKNTATRASILFKAFPKAKRYKDTNLPDICPFRVDNINKKECYSYDTCGDCLSKYWNEVIE